MVKQSKIRKNILDLINQTFSELSKIKNDVPYRLKTTFNFKGRKSVDLASKFIETVTNKGDKILDPFMGSGSFVISGVSANRETYGVELDNYTFSAVNTLFSEVDNIKLKNYYETIKKRSFKDIMDLYKTSCCGVQNHIDKLHFDPESLEYFHPIVHRDIKNNHNIIMTEKCPVCENKTKQFSEEDMSNLKSLESIDISRFPSHKLIENSRINITATTGADYYDRNFTTRAKIALLKLQNAIDELPESPEKLYLEHCLVASLTIARTCQYGSGSEYIYQVMRTQAQEKNVWKLFESKYKAFNKFQKEYPRLIKKPEERKLYHIYNSDYRDFLFDPADSFKEYFSLIVTDPPYTDQVPFLERSQLYRDWLSTFYNDQFKLTDKMLEDEIVVSNSPQRENKHDYKQYYQDIDEMFSNFYKILKPDGIILYQVKLGKNKYLKTLGEYINLARKNGFELAGSLGIDKKDPSLRKQAAYLNTLTKEILIAFVKLDEDNRYLFIDNTNYENKIIKKIYNLLKSLPSGKQLSELVQHIIRDLQHNHDVIAPDPYLTKIKKIIKDNFYITDNSVVTIDPDRLYLSLEDSSDLFAKLYDTIPVIIRSFQSEDGFTLDDLFYEIFVNLLSGDANTLEKILNESSYQNQIKNLLDNYCDHNENRYFIRKIKNTVNENSTDVSSMDGYEFEKLIRRLLIKQGYEDVIRIGGACDRGVDLVAKKLENGSTVGYIFQCKRWIGNVGGTPIQRLHSMKIQMSPTIKKAVCITTSNYTTAGKNEANNTGVEIINGKDLMIQLEREFPGEYYHGAFSLLFE